VTWKSLDAYDVSNSINQGSTTISSRLIYPQPLNEFAAILLNTLLA
jgi:hypothetical protein